MQCCVRVLEIVNNATAKLGSTKLDNGSGDTNHKLYMHINLINVYL